MSQRQQRLIEELMVIAIDQQTYPIEARKYPRFDDDYRAFTKTMLKYEDALQEPGLPFALSQYLKVSNLSLEALKTFIELLRASSWGQTIDEMSIEAYTFILARASARLNWEPWVTSKFGLAAIYRPSAKSLSNRLVEELIDAKIARDKQKVREFNVNAVILASLFIVSSPVLFGLAGYLIKILLVREMISLFKARPEPYKANHELLLLEKSLLDVDTLPVVGATRSSDLNSLRALFREYPHYPFYFWIGRRKSRSIAAQEKIY